MAGSPHSVPASGGSPGPGTSGGLAPYRVSKAGLNALTRTVADSTGSERTGLLWEDEQIVPW